MAGNMRRATAAQIPASDAGKLRDVGRNGAHFLPALSAEQRLLLCCPGGTASLLAHLQEARLLADAVSLLSYALPEREAVWWACLCVEQGEPGWCDPAQQQVLLAAREWVRYPGDVTKSRCLHAAKAVGAVGAPALAARAAFAANLADAASLRAGRRVERSVAEAASVAGADQLSFRHERFLLIGLDIAAGGTGRIWPAGQPWAGRA